MNPQKEYINTDLFTRRFKEIFVPREALGTNLLILCGNALRSIELLIFAKENDVIILIS
jgi:hypothetical protein